MLTSDFGFLDNAGVAGRQIAQIDWSSHPLGPIASWPPVLRMGLSIMLSSRFPSFLAWTDQLHMLFNAPYLEFLTGRPDALQGTSMSALWPEVADTALPLCSEVFAGKSMFFEDMPLSIIRNGRAESNFFTFSFSPVRDEQGVVCGVLGTLIETTEKVLAVAGYQKAKEDAERNALEKHEAAESVRAAYGLLQAVADGSGDAIASLDCDFRFTFTNVSYRQNFRSVFGVDAVLGDRLHEALAHMPDDQRQAVDLWGRALNGERINIETEFGDETRDRRRWRFRFYPIYDSEGRVVGAAHNAADISDVMKAHSERERLLAELQEQDRRKDEFLAMLAHELRNPLAPISAAASVLRMRTLDPKRVAVTSEVIGRQVAHMTNLIDDLLDVSRVTRGLVTLNIATEPLGGILNDAIEQVTPLIRAKGQRISLQLAPEVVLVSGDKKRLVQALSNILNNAAKYTPDGGHILLATTVTEAHVKIEVTDDGVGMDIAFTSRAFELFSQAERSSDRASGGLGLGLALVKSLVELHHGKVSAFSAGLGKGSTFSMILPCLSEREGRQASTLYDDAAHQGVSPLRIMVVDDNQDAALMVAMLLEAAGHEVSVEHVAKAALVHSAVARPDVFLLDIGLPEMDGNTLARHLRAQPETASAKLIAVTGYGQEHDREATRAAGFDHHLVKPLDSDHLLRLLSDVAQAKR